MRQTGGAMQLQFIVGLSLLVVGCAWPPASEISTSFYICESNLRRVQAFQSETGEITRIEISLTSEASRKFELFTKSEFGGRVRIVVGKATVLEKAALSIVRGGRIELKPDPGEGETLYETLRQPPQTPCGPAA